MSCTTRRHDHIVARFYRRHHGELTRKLRHQFPGCCHASVDDAISYAYRVVLEKESPTAHGACPEGDDGLFGFIFVIAWRFLRAECRKQRPVAGDPDTVSCQHTNPETISASRELLYLINHLVPEAAKGFGCRKAKALERALRDRLTGGTDSHVARCHAIPREYVNRARLWLVRKLAHAAS